VLSRRLFAVLALVGFAMAGCGREADETGAGDVGAVRFAVLSSEPAAVQEKVWSPIIADMEASTGLRVKPSFVNDGPALVEAMGRRKIDLGWFSNQAGLEAVRKAGGEVFARPMAAQGVGDDYSILIVSAHSKVTLERVLNCDRTLTLGVGEVRSTSSSLAPETYLFGARGMWPARCFRQVRRGSHEANLAAVAGGQLDVAATSTAWLARLPSRMAASQVREIWRSPVLPANPILWRRDMDPAIKEKLRQFFLTYGQGDSPQAAAQRANLAKIGVGGFTPADDSHLLPAREMEATHLWLEARESGDAARTAAARAALDAVTAERLALEARTRAPAAAQ